jgi:hypothetical protein
LIQFISADPGLTIDAIPGTWSEQKPKKYKPIMSHEYVNMRMNATYVEGISKLKGKVNY